MYGPSIEESKKNKIHSSYKLVSSNDIDKEFKGKSFDAVIALDFIEHLEKNEGNSLLNKMEGLAKKKVVIFTPNGFLEQGVHYNNPLQIHKSGWTIDEMQKRGYKVFGINGMKPIRGDNSQIKLNPKWFWWTISIVSQFFVFNRPKYAFQILCVKEIHSI